MILRFITFSPLNGLDPTILSIIEFCEETKNINGMLTRITLVFLLL